eukprot:TRINITY_DN1935_c0_g1_i1.p1 TRINITY_DN1935_c0_g1~~TRINITY_DN1935_c0_g1_i1.p1  ORF type:complete len:351 (+),score=86.43 TRINITY_DN1935_c0_g1_i1:103-1053(+)
MKHHEAILDRIRQEIGRPDGLKPIIYTPEFRHCVCLVSVVKEGIYLVSPLRKEIDPLLIVELLISVWDLFERYIGPITVESLQLNFMTLLFVMDEMVDGGTAFVTEPNILTEIIPKPNILEKVTKKNIALKKPYENDLPIGATSMTPWRRHNPRYIQDRILFDITEQLDCRFDGHGRPDHCKIWGEITCKCNLSGTPILRMNLRRAELLESLTFHQSIKLREWDETHKIVFLPPDGEFMLLKYCIREKIVPPFKIDSAFKNDELKISLELNIAEMSLEKVKIIVPWTPDLIPATSVNVSRGTITIGKDNSHSNFST